MSYLLVDDVDTLLTEPEFFCARPSKTLDVAVKV